MNYWEMLVYNFIRSSPRGSTPFSIELPPCMIAGDGVRRTFLDSDSDDTSDPPIEGDSHPRSSVVSFPNSIDALPESDSFVSDSSVEIDPPSDCSDSDRDAGPSFLDDDDSEFEMSVAQILDRTQCQIDREYSASSQEVAAAVVTDLPAGHPEEDFLSSHEESEGDSDS
jgi:hypothetical protein